MQTKDFKIAKLVALHYLMDKAMTIKKYEIDLSRGILKAEGKEDHEMLLEALGKLPEYLIRAQYEEVELNRSPTPPAVAVPQGGTPVKNTDEPVPKNQPNGNPKLKTKLFSTATELYLAEKKLDNTQKTIDEKRATYKEFMTLFGDVDTNAIGSEPAISYKNKLIADNFSATRINKAISFLRDFFNYAINNKLYFDNNPFEKLNISKKSKLHQSIESYEEFTDEDLQTIFGSHHYTSYMNKPDYFWLPFLGLFTGARIESLACLRVSDIRIENGVWVFNIYKDKNSNSIRKVPIHKTIIESKFLDYVESVKGENGQLFPHLKPGKNGYSKNCSRRFSDYLELIGVKSKRKSFHSFRPTFINRMTNLNIHPAILMGIVGHYEQSKIDFSSSHFTTYQKKKPMEVLRDAINQLSYENLKLDF